MYLKFTGMMLNMLCEINPNYKNNIHVDRYGRKFLYGKLNKAVYGTLIGARCWFNELTRVLKKYKFEQNPYDECCWNKIVNGNQLTVIFHVDDILCSHSDQAVLDELLNDLRKEFGKLDELAEEKGLIHDYLGMRIDFSIPYKVAFTMFNYLEDIVVEAPEELKPKNCMCISK